MQTQEAEIEKLVQQLRALTGESTEEAMRNAVKERLDRLGASDREAFKARILAITSQVAAMPLLDGREPDEILGYNEHGHFD